MSELRRRDLLAGALASCCGAPAPRSHELAIERAIDRAGGLGPIARGDTVLLKVNCNSGDPPPYSTSPVLVRWLAARFRDAGARVLVGDRSFWGDGDTAGNLERNGIAAAARAAGATVVVLDDAIDWLEIPEDLLPSWRPPVRVPRLVERPEQLVNLACMKTHFISGATLALKNFLGLVHAADRRRPGNLRSHDPARLHRQIAELHRFVRARLHLVDGHRALCAGGPTPASGNPPIVRDLGVVLADRDPVALDAAAFAHLARHAAPSEPIHGTDPWQSPTIAAARALGL